MYLPAYGCLSDQYKIFYVLSTCLEIDFCFIIYIVPYKTKNSKIMNHELKIELTSLAKSFLQENSPEKLEEIKSEFFRKLLRQCNMSNNTISKAVVMWKTDIEDAIERVRNGSEIDKAFIGMSFIGLINLLDIP